MAAQVAQSLLPMSAAAVRADRLAVAITQDCTPTGQRRLPVELHVTAAVAEALATTTAVALAVVVFVTDTAARVAAVLADQAADKSVD